MSINSVSQHSAVLDYSFDKVAEPANFAFIVESLRNRTTPLSSHACRNVWMVQQPRNGLREIGSIVRLIQNSGGHVAEKRPNRRQVARYYRQSARPVFEDFHRDVEPELSRVLQGTDPDSRFAQRSRHMFVYHPPAKFNIRR